MDFSNRHQLRYINHAQPIMWMHILFSLAFYTLLLIAFTFQRTLDTILKLCLITCINAFSKLTSSFKKFNISQNQLHFSKKKLTPNVSPKNATRHPNPFWYSHFLLHLYWAFSCFFVFLYNYFPYSSFIKCQTNKNRPM